MSEDEVKQAPAADETAVRVALWRALHLEVDPPPHALNDDIGLKLAAPADGWRDRGDMHPDGTKLFRASIVARARFIEDLAAEQANRGVGQYVLLGAGLDTFVQRRPEFADRLNVFEVDQPAAQAWKRSRLEALGYGVAEWLHLVAFDFESDGSWWDHLIDAGFDPRRPAVVASTGVSMYLTKDANAATLRQLARLAPGSTFAMTFQPPSELLSDSDRAVRERVEKGAAAAGTPFISYFTPAELLGFARQAGFAGARHVSADDLNERYFAGRTDGLATSNAEEILLATT